MLLHSIADPLQVFYMPPGGAAVQCQEIPGGHGIVEGVRENGGFTVSRLISTDPRAYLNPQYAPGGRL